MLRIELNFNKQNHSLSKKLPFPSTIPLKVSLCMLNFFPGAASVTQIVERKNTCKITDESKNNSSPFYNNFLFLTYSIPYNTKNFDGKEKQNKKKTRNVQKK